MANPSKVIGSFWFTEHSGRSFGIVKINTSDGLRFYIGSAKSADEKKDTAYIHKYGAPLNVDQLAKFLWNMKPTYIYSSNSDTAQEKVVIEKSYHKQILGVLMVGIGLWLAIATYFL